MGVKVERDETKTEVKINGTIPKSNYMSKVMEYAIIPIKDSKYIIEGNVKIEAINGYPEVTIDRVTLMITFPEFAGARSMA